MNKESNPFINNAPSAAAKKSTDIVYENNPFFVATNGVELLFNKARSVGIFIVILLGLSFLWSLPSTFSGGSSQAPSTAPSSYPPMNGVGPRPSTTGENFINALAQIPPTVWIIGIIIVLIIILVALLISFIFRGILDYTSARLARGYDVTIGEAFKATIQNFWGYAWVLFIVSLKTFLWSLLFIIPGFIMSVRYSLAGPVYFDTKLKGNAAVKRSLDLTKNAWLTTYASQSLLPMITMGVAGDLFVPGTNAVLYRQLGSLTDKNTPKPSAHIVSWLTLILPILFVILIAMLIGILAYSLSNYLHS